MLNKKMKISAGIAVFLCFCFISLSTAQTANMEKMNKDLKIMERVLDQMINKSSEHTLFTAKTKAVYLDNYGAVFMVPLNSANMMFISVMNDDLHEKNADKKDDSSQKSYNFDSYAPFSLKSKNTSFKEIKGKMLEFLERYVHTIKLLKPEERITLVVMVNEESRLAAEARVIYRQALNQIVEVEVAASDKKKKKVEEAEEENLIKSYIMTVTKENVMKYRNGTISKDEFAKKVQYLPVEESMKKPGDNQMIEDINILKTILKTELEETLEKSFLSEYINGTYLNDYGVLFTVTIPNLLLTIKADVIMLENKNNKKKTERVILNSRGRRAEFQSESIEDDIKDAIFNVLANYGSSLRRVAPDENIVILFSAKSSFTVAGDTDFMLVVKKKSILDYESGKLSLDKLKQVATIQNFNNR